MQLQKTNGKEINMNNNLLKSMIKNTNGKFFTCFFVKKDGTLRKMTARVGVKKGLANNGFVREEKENLVCVYDMVAHDFRFINLSTLKSLKCGKLEYKVEY